MSTVAVVPRDVLVARGPDAVSYLQGQLSQDVGALDVGGSAFSFLLQPQGKVDAWLRVTRIAEDAFALDVDAGWGEPVAARLRRFLLRTKVEIEPVDWMVLAVPGGDLVVPDGAWRVIAEAGEGFDVLGPDLQVPEGVSVLDADRYEQHRIAAAVPRMGAELDESTIPAAVGVVDRSVSFTKGCYTGQELVARIDSRGGKVPTRLRRLTGDVAAGATLHDGDREIGRVTSAAGGVALGYVRRDVEPPAEAVARWDGGEAAVRIHP